MDYDEQMIAKDVTRQRTQLKKILERISGAILLITQQGVIEYVNQKTTELFGYTQQELIGQPVENLVPLRHHDSVKSQYDDFMSSVRQDMQSGREMCGLHRSGHEFPIEIGLNTFYEQNKMYAVISIVDITKRKQFENEIDHKNKEISNMLTVLKQKNIELEQFAYITSHDLKAPLRAIDNLSTWIEEDSKDKLSPESIEHIHLLRQRVKRMAALIDGILAYSRVGRVDTEIESVDINELIYEVIESLLVPVGFKINVAESMPTLNAPRVPLMQVFSNLISNAIKYHDSDHGQVDIIVESDDHYYYFTVSDDGPGIDSQYHSKIFDMFQTLNPRDIVESTGIGLTIVKKIISHIGGSIHVHSQVGEGASFRFSWPRQDMSPSNKQSRRTKDVESGS